MYNFDIIKFITGASLKYRIILLELLSDLRTNRRISADIGGKSADNVDSVFVNIDYMDIIMKYADEHGEFKSKDIQDLLKLQGSRTRQLISILIKEGLLERHGSGRSTYYTKNKSTTNE